MARLPRATQKVRLNLDMSEEVKRRLEELRDLTQADSLSEVIRRSLTVYDKLVTEQRDGWTTILRRKENGTSHEKEIILP